MAAALLELRGLSKRFVGTAEAPGPEVLKKVDLSVGAGESLAIVGPSGSGKSTLLHLIAGLIAPDEGEILFDGQALPTEEDELAAYRNEQIGFVFQAHHLLPQCSALENVTLPALARGDAALRRRCEERGRELLTEVGLGERMGNRPAQLSGGECQRVAVVRALIMEPKLLLADEPTGSLDAESAEALGDLLGELNRRESLTLITVTHAPALAARMQKVFELRAGQLRETTPA